jgi:hypothetical protein
VIIKVRKEKRGGILHDQRAGNQKNGDFFINHGFCADSFEGVQAIKTDEGRPGSG